MNTGGAVAAPVFEHLYRMSDRRGVFEHALHSEPRAEHGYCLDDVARALVIACREPDPPLKLQQLARRCLDFTLSALQPDGSCHNRMSSTGNWSDTPELGDWWGRALWGLGVAALHSPTRAMRARALLGFRTAARRRSPHLRAMAFAGLGAGQLLLARPGEMSARRLLRDVVTAIGCTDTEPEWPWPETRLSYGNGSIVEALLLAGDALPDPAAQNRGLCMLQFLLRMETHDDHLSVTPVGGRGQADPKPAFDQQPIEVAAIAAACGQAYEVTDDAGWLRGVRLAWAWFLGDNDIATPMFDPSTGAGFDGLQPDGRNLNQGAESTLAVLSTAQSARRYESRD